ncbi:phosphate ABC transporter permease subunit PstC [Termitidicoccus mucosus]|uniref:Phosphate transport system permease protein n=1 Tax=Termitidicoccus mucosus TaxID=1184151 RepID=A0A178IHE8_9BACT|nr:phosphate ABC transporter permease [Opitutaceae bacterium TSB47]
MPATAENTIPTSATPARPAFAITKKRTRFLGLTLDECIQAFFGGNALVALIVLALIMVFLFREGAAFFGQNQRNLIVYRQAGLEYVDHIRRQETAHTALTRQLYDLRLAAFTQLTQKQQLSPADANARLAALDDFSGRFSDAVMPIRGLVSDLGEVATAIKTRFNVNEDKTTQRAQLLAEGHAAEAAQVVIEPVDFAAELQPILDTLPLYRETNAAFAAGLETLLSAAPPLSQIEPGLDARMDEFKRQTRAYIATFPEIERKLAAWDYARPVPFTASLSAFIFGRDWLTASFWQDWYGIIPLFTGSLLVSIIALLIAVPLGVGAAIYVNQVATPREQRLIKPAIEFISAFPSVVLGFFGIAVLGELLRRFSQADWVHWVPGFPIIERLNALTAGCLLALISIPTIFTLAEDALNNVPRALKEASYALGASRLQTIIKIITPAALSGIISAILLGFGRVIGETMIVLLCAGNRIAIPDFTSGPAAVTQPVHTMTGIIAQEMGEVVRGSIHYRALFVVGIVLFLLSLAINYAAQKIVTRYRIAE